MTEADAQPTFPEDNRPADPNAAPPADSGPAQKLAELEARHADVSDAFLRAQAEMQNVRRRAEEEMSKARKFAIESFAEACCR